MKRPFKLSLEQLSKNQIGKKAGLWSFFFQVVFSIFRVNFLCYLLAFFVMNEKIVWLDSEAIFRALPKYGYTQKASDAIYDWYHR